MVLVAPNRVPEWIQPVGPVVLSWPAGAWEALPARTNRVGRPAIPLVWRAIEPGDHRFGYERWGGDGAGKNGHEYRFRFSLARDPGSDVPTPRGTVFVLHGYGESAESLFPWGVYLAQAGWRSVLVDLRGHGGSGGNRVSLGVREVGDLRELRQQLMSAGVAVGPTVALGHSMGASLALGWQAADSGVSAVVAFGPYARLGRTVVRMRDARASWVPRIWARGIGEELPRLLGVGAEGLDPVGWIRGRAPRALVIAGAEDAITPVSEAFELRPHLGEGSALMVVGPAEHEQLPYLMDQHGALVLRWLAGVPGQVHGGGCWMKGASLYGPGEAATEPSPP